MASLKSVIEELDIINEKVERIRMSLEKAREHIDYLHDRTAEHRNAADLSAIELLWYAYDHGSFATTDKTKKWYEDVEAVLKAADGG